MKDFDFWDFVKFVFQCLASIYIFVVGVSWVLSTPFFNQKPETLASSKEEFDRLTSFSIIPKIIGSINFTGFCVFIIIALISYRAHKKEEKEKNLIIYLKNFAHPLIRCHALDQKKYLREELKEHYSCFHNLNLEFFPDEEKYKKAGDIYFETRDYYLKKNPLPYILGSQPRWSDFPDEWLIKWVLWIKKPAWLNRLLERFDIRRIAHIILCYRTDKHLLSIAPNRTGKGRGLILPNLLSLPYNSVFVIDPKGENALVSARYRKSQGHEIVIFNPHGVFADEFAARGFTQFQSFNPLANLDPKSPNFSADITVLAEAIIYQTGGDSHWTESAQGLIEFLIMYLVTEPTEEATFRRLRSILAKGHEGIKEIRARCAVSEYPQVQDTIERYAIETGEVYSILATAETQTRIFKNEAICSALEGGAFDFGRMKNEKTSVYLILPTEYLITEARYLRLVLLVAMSHFMRSEKGAFQVLCLLDEFANLGALKIIENGYGIIAGHGVTLWSFVQNLTQLKNLYKNNWEVFIANSAVVTVSNVNDVETAKYFSERAGRKKVSNVSYSSGSSSGNAHNSTTTSEGWEDTLPVRDLYEADKDDIFIFIEGKAEPIRANKQFYDYWNAPFWKRADKNPMHEPTVKNSAKKREPFIIQFQQLREKYSGSEYSQEYIEELELMAHEWSKSDPTLDTKELTRIIDRMKTEHQKNLSTPAPPEPDGATADGQNQNEEPQSQGCGA